MHWAAVLIILGVYAVITIIMVATQDGDTDLTRQKHALVVVMGDLGHSPRMNFHALSIANCGWKVTLVGYKDSDLMEQVASNPNIHLSALPTPTPRSGNFAVWALKRVIQQHFQLWSAFSRANKSSKVDVVMVQNPPSIPTLGIARVFTLFQRAKLIVDWHNLGFTILGMKTTSKPALFLYKTYEKLFGRVAYLQLCVSIRLGLALRDMGCNPKRIMPLYDRPFKSYALLPEQVVPARREFEEMYNEPADKWVVTSTSYTPDEDLDMFLEGLALYDQSTKRKHTLNVFVTGKGPLKEQFLAKVQQQHLKHVAVHTAWLSYEGYHRLLSVCDIGVSMHQSSSGWDLPMKAIDMFGAGIPVLSLGFPALDELIKDGKNGMIFKSAKGLCQNLLEATNDHQLYKQIKDGAILESQNTWEDQWNTKIGPVFGYGQYPVDDADSSDSD